MTENSLKHRPVVHTIDDMRKRAFDDARALVKACGGLNKAAFAIGMSKGRLSFIHRGVWTQCAVNEIDLAMLETGRVVIEKDLDLTQQARVLLAEHQKKLAELHDINARLMRVLRRL